MKFTGLLFIALLIMGCNTFEELEDPFACDDYCDSYEFECFDLDLEELNPPFDGDRGTCVEHCLNFFENDPGAAGEVTGDTVQCRIQHLELIGDDGGGARVHCGHAGPISNPCREDGVF